MRICVFCGSSSGARPAYREAAVRVGSLLAAKHVGLVYGGSNVGLMGAMADAALEAGGEVIGVIPEPVAALEVAHRGLADLRVVGSMHERKALMADLSDAFIAMPGGYGTLDEFAEVLTWSQLGIHRKACGLLNVEGYFDGLLAFFDHTAQERFLRRENRELVLCDSDPERLIDRVLTTPVPLIPKWVDRQKP